MKVYPFGWIQTQNANDPYFHPDIHLFCEGGGGGLESWNIHSVLLMYWRHGAVLFFTRFRPDIHLFCVGGGGGGFESWNILLCRRSVVRFGEKFASRRTSSGLNDSGEYVVALGRLIRQFISTQI